MKILMKSAIVIVSRIISYHFKNYDKKLRIIPRVFSNCSDNCYSECYGCRNDLKYCELMFR